MVFKAAVIESRDQWYSEGQLAKVLCEEVQENENTQPRILRRCCACDEAKYEVSVTGSRVCKVSQFFYLYIFHILSLFCC